MEAGWFVLMVAVSLIIVLLVKWCMKALSGDTNRNTKNNRNTRYQYHQTTDLNQMDWEEPYTYVDYGCDSGNVGDSFVVHNIGGDNWGDTGQGDNFHTRSRDSCCDNDNSGGRCDSGGGDTGGCHSGGGDTGGCDSGGGDTGGCDSGGGDTGGCDSGGGCDD